jgi:hypothetical protein
MKANLAQLFVLSEAFERSAARAEFASSTDGLDDWVVGDCTEKIRLKQMSRGNLRDLVGTTHAGFYLLSRRVQEALHREKVTGWRACPIQFTDADGKANDNYSAIGITARCGPLDNARSEKILRLAPESGAPSSCWIGLFFDEDTWSGADLFRPDGTMLTLATSRAKAVIEGIGATNVRFRNMLEVERAVL